MKVETQTYVDCAQQCHEGHGPPEAFFDLSSQLACFPWVRNDSFNVISAVCDSWHHSIFEDVYNRNLKSKLCVQDQHGRVLNLF